MCVWSDFYGAKWILRRGQLDLLEIILLLIKILEHFHKIYELVLGGKQYISAPESKDSLLHFTKKIVSAHAGKNNVGLADLSAVIRNVYSTLPTLGEAPQVADHPQSAIAVKKPIFPRYIICLKDGKS